MVSRANPAARNQYQQAGYPPASTSQQPAHGDYTMDPFFDDEDGDDAMTPGFSPRPNGLEPSIGASLHMPSNPSLRTTNTLMDSVSDLPLTSHAVPPAGIRARTGAIPKDWDDPFGDDVAVLPPPPAQAQASQSAESKPSGGKKYRKPFRWPWQKPVELEGERKIWLNDRGKNDLESYCSNYVSTGKYNAVTFLPKFFVGE